MAGATVWAALAWAALAAAAAADARRGRVPNALVLAAAFAAGLAAPSPATALGAAVAAAPLFVLALPRLLGMGDVKYAFAVGAVLGLAAVPWWWAWSALGAALTLTAGAVVARDRDRLPLAPALFAAAIVTVGRLAR